MPIGIKEDILAAAKAYQAGKFHEVILTAQKVLDRDPSNINALDLMGIALYSTNKMEGAVDNYKALLSHQKTANNWYMLGLCYGSLGKGGEALQAHREAITLNPNHCEALSNAGLYLCKAGLFENANEVYQRAIHLAPTNVAIHNNYANALKDGGFLSDAKTMYKRALTLNPNLHSAMSNYCYVGQFDPMVTLTELKESHSKWDQRFCVPEKVNWPQHQNSKDPERALRVGLISEDFRHHTVGHYLISVLENLPADLDLHLYSLSNQCDDLTNRFKACGVFSNVAGIGDHDLAQRVLSDEIDVLFDLSGHTSGSRLRAFCEKPAPVQMTWLGYVGTTGVSAIDYKIGSYASIPEGSERFYKETVLRFPEPYPHQCYSPGCFGEVEVGPAPSIKNGYVTFGSFSTVAKLNPQVVSTWSRVLMRVEGSKLILKSHGYNSEYTKSRLLGEFAEHGVAPERINFEGFTPPPDAFDTYNQIDIVLDPWPFSGCTTTCEALWMGVPIITWPHETEASRHTVSFLSALELVDGVVDNERAYVEAASSLAHNLPRRAALRKTLRQTLLESPLCDGAAYGRMVGEMIRTAWRKWCE